MHRNAASNLVAIVDTSKHPKSSLEPNLESLEALAQKYKAQTFASVTELLQDPIVGPSLDGVVVATPHASHYAVAKQILQHNKNRNRNNNNNNNSSKTIHMLMEKPFTTNVHQAKELHDMIVAQQQSQNSFYFGINHSANFRTQAQVARQLIVEQGTIGDIRHITAFMSSALSWIFDDPSQVGWNEPASDMLGNGFGWGQSSHLLAWIYHVCGPQNLVPTEVFCAMNHSKTTGADVSHAATILCRRNNDDGDDNDNNNDDPVVFSLSDTSLLPGNLHSDPPVGKQIRINIFGTKGAIVYSGIAGDRSSGRLELRCMPRGEIEYPNATTTATITDTTDTDTLDAFDFENFEKEGSGPESLQSFVDDCCGKGDCYVGADSLTGLRTVQTLEAMYRSNQSKQLETVEQSL